MFVYTNRSNAHGSSSSGKNVTLDVICLMTPWISFWIAFCDFLGGSVTLLLLIRFRVFAFSCCCFFPTSWSSFQRQVEQSSNNRAGARGAMGGGRGRQWRVIQTKSYIMSGVLFIMTIECGGWGWRGIQTHPLYYLTTSIGSGGGGWRQCRGVQNTTQRYVL